MEERKPIRTVLEKWQLATWLLSTLLVFSLIFSITTFNGFNIFIIGIVWAIPAYYLSRYLCRAETTLVYNNDLLIIERFCKPLNISEEYHLYLHEIRGFEIAEVTRGSMAIVLYLTNFECKRFSLTNIEGGIKAEKILKKKLPILTKDTNVNFPSFKKAYWFALKKCSIFLLISLPLAFLLIDNKQTLQLSTLVLVISVLIIAIVTWFYSINKPVKINQFRFGAFYWFSNFMIYLSPLLIFPMHLKYSDYSEIPIKLTSPYEIRRTAPADLYAFDMVKYDPKSVIVTNYFYGSTSSKSSNFPVRHYVLTPFTAGQPIIDNGIYEIWLAKSFEQILRKRDASSVHDTKARAYQNKIKTEFASLFSERPVFYKSMFSNREAYQTLSGSRNAAKFNIVLEPHWETLKEYRSDLMLQSLLLLAAIFGANLIGCLIIAYNR